MGQDIHNKNFIYSKVEQRYIDGLSLTDYPEYSPFGPLFTGRNYDLFSIFGSQRGNLPELKHANYGIPDFLPETYKQYLKECDYYGFIWWKLPDFKRSLLEYIQLMTNPYEFYKANEDEWMLDAIDAGEFDERAYDEEMTYIWQTLKQFVHTIDAILAYQSDYESMKKLIDFNQTVFLFYFDS